MANKFKKDCSVQTNNKIMNRDHYKYQETIPLTISDFDFFEKDTDSSKKKDQQGSGISFDQIDLTILGKKEENNKKRKITNNEFISLVENDKYNELKKYFKNKLITDLNVHDQNNESALIIAIQNDSYRMVKLLFRNGADPLVTNKEGWSAIQQATFFGNRKIIKLVYSHLQIKLHSLYENQLPVMLEKISQLPDFMMKMDWEINTWFPFLTKFLPNDEYIIWKNGSSIRVECTLIGLDKKKWIRGSISILLTGLDTSTPGDVFIIDHDRKTYFNTSNNIVRGKNALKVTKSDIDSLLENDMVKSEINTDQVVFERKKSWFSEKKKTQKIANWDTKVFEIKNLIYEATIRQIKRKKKKKKHHNSLGSVPQFNLIKKSKNFTGTICVANDFPLTIEKMMPIFEVLARTNEHFQKLKDFVSIKHPFVGFPIKMEVPVYAGLSAIVTFPHFQQIGSIPELFKIPKGYHEINKLSLRHRHHHQKDKKIIISKKHTKLKKKYSNKKIIKKNITVKKKDTFLQEKIPNRKKVKVSNDLLDYNNKKKIKKKISALETKL
ncbi:ankyrin repeat domain-containing protein 13c [Anaeramoeba flamelloides]|uniref:Ankyrin repeat domain-containing protein 13c n=1 Tax=Anaeramoeba flamelloides TaxID=1746091 RepID=A0ABQ8YY45_9EUKA|nr:ankyrin repeat domain-containing protein 13c [Anaeramoeba flamelloides]